MQTKNTNVDIVPICASVPGILDQAIEIEKNMVFQYQPFLSNGKLVTSLDMGPPLPPRCSGNFSPANLMPKLRVEVEGYGPYKPVPPPKPIQPSQTTSVTPPPYRMPPYPPYTDVITIPGTAGNETPPHALHTHSNKFPIEREVVLCSTDKNTKIPLLHEYKKKTKGTVAPDAPPIQMAAWTQNGHQPAPGFITSQNIGNVNPDYRPQVFDTVFHSVAYNNAPQNLYNDHGAIPKSCWQSDIESRSGPTITSGQINNSQINPTVGIQIEHSKDVPKDATANLKNSKSVSKTYHAIKDIISNRFKSTKDTASIDDKCEERSLNNASEEMRQSQLILKCCDQDNRNSNEHGQASNIQFNANAVIQQDECYQKHLLLSSPQHQVLSNPQLRVNQEAYQQLLQSRSQEILNHPDPRGYYPNACLASVPVYQKPAPNECPTFNHQQNVQMLRTPYTNHHPIVESSQMLGKEPRSAQQIERDSQKRYFEARRAASQPHLLRDDNSKECSNPNQQLLESKTDKSSTATATTSNNCSDTVLCDKITKSFLDNLSASAQKDRVTEILHDSQRQRLEGEIGKIEGVYNVGGQIKSDVINNKSEKKSHTGGSVVSSDYDKTGGQCSSNADSGRGSAAYSSGRKVSSTDAEACDSNPMENKYLDLKSHNKGNDTEWVDVVDTELRQILEPKMHDLSLHTSGLVGTNSLLSDSASSMTPPLPPLTPDNQSSPTSTPKHLHRFAKHNSLPYGSHPEYDAAYHKFAQKGNRNGNWYGNVTQKHHTVKKVDHSNNAKGKLGMECTDLTSTTTRSLDLESLMDEQSDSEELSTTDARKIRKQLEGLESMYSEVLKVLGVKRYGRGYQPSDPRFHRRRYGSMSSLPSSSVSSRPIRDKRRAHEDRKKVRDIRGINKRFQRLESHVVTLARSVAHLSSEMRTQHLMMQEMENIRGEIIALRTHANMLNVKSQAVARAGNTVKGLPTIANPTRVKKLTKFFGDEPPLVRLFLRKLGYEKYASIFENERIGMVELPYLSEERLQKMGIPLGPRLRIMQEAQISVCKENTLCIV